MDKHVVLIGLNYQPKRSTGDKNFWVELVPLLARKLKRLSILSVRKRPQKQEEIMVDNCLIAIKYLDPSFLETPDAQYDRLRIFWRKGAYPSWLGVVEKRMNIRHIISELDSIYQDCPFSHIHLIDNFGWGNRLITQKGKKLAATVSVSAMAYQGKNPWLYHPYLRLSYDNPNLTVVPYSAAFKEKLTALGITEERIRHIPWGVKFSENDCSSQEKETIRKDLGLPADIPLFLWAGYIQQILKNDFLFALHSAREALSKGLQSTFYFAFKPEAYEKGFSDFHNPDLGIYVSSTTVEQFKALKAAADVFYSPVINKKCILAPPLTWIEMMSQGVPILTTDVPGAAEIVENGRTGYLAEDEKDLVKKIALIRDNYFSMKSNCLEKVKNDYSLFAITEKYLNLWLKEGN